MSVMADIVDQQTRSRMMSRIRGSNTKPEILLRRALHAEGFRFRINVRRLPGTPDIILPRWNAAILVHGCFWHRHPGCPKATTPASNRSFWQEKFTANVKRDRRALLQLDELGWRTLTIWECAIGRHVPAPLVQEVAVFLRGNGTELRGHDDPIRQGEIALSSNDPASFVVVECHLAENSGMSF